MGIARHLAAHRAQPEAFGGVVTGCFHAAIVEEQHFGTPAFEEQFTVIGPVCGLAQERQTGIEVQLGLERAEGGAI